MSNVEPGNYKTMTFSADCKILFSARNVLFVFIMQCMDHHCNWWVHYQTAENGIWGKIRFFVHVGGACTKKTFGEKVVVGASYKMGTDEPPVTAFASLTEKPPSPFVCCCTCFSSDTFLSFDPFFWSLVPCPLPSSTAACTYLDTNLHHRRQ